MKLQVLSSSFGKVLAATAIAFMISSATTAHAQQQQWGRNNCLYTWMGNGWQQTRTCRRLERGNPNIFVIYDSADRARLPILRVDLSQTATGWIYAYNFVTGANFRYINRGVWQPSAPLSDFNFYSNGAWRVVAQPAAATPRPTVPTQGAPTMSAEARASNEAAAKVMTQMQMGGLIKSMSPNDSSPTPLPICSPISGSPCSDGQTRP
jgi:hypothetical protein